MIGVNLIPAERRRVHRIRLRLRRWSIGTAGYALFVVVALLVVHAVGASDDHTVRSEISAATALVNKGNESIAGIRSELAEAKAVLQANLTVGNQPDWSVLLALLSHTANDEIVFRRVRLRRAAAAGEGGIVASDGPLALEIDGVGRTQHDVSEFVLRMDAVALFHEVRLHDTRREPFLDGHGTAFRVTCRLQSGEE